MNHELRKNRRLEARLRRVKLDLDAMVERITGERIEDLEAVFARNRKRKKDAGGFAPGLLLTQDEYREFCKFYGSREGEFEPVKTDGGVRYRRINERVERPSGN